MVAYWHTFAIDFFRRHDFACKISLTCFILEHKFKNSNLYGHSCPSPWRRSVVMILRLPFRNHVQWGGRLVLEDEAFILFCFLLLSRLIRGLRDVGSYHRRIGLIALIGDSRLSSLHLLAEVSKHRAIRVSFISTLTLASRLLWENFS